jgi:transaldolase
MGLTDLQIKIFADGANLAGIMEMYRLPFIDGFTTNPTLMRSAGVSDYAAFAQELLQAIPDKPVSFETFADEFNEMERQAHEIASWGDNVYVKIPITNSLGLPATDLLRRLRSSGVRVNVTALMSVRQVATAAEALAGGPSCFVSVFAGRIADTGRDPVPIMRKAIEVMSPFPNLELIWASCRELLNVFQANDIGCHIITVTNDLLRKAEVIGMELEAFSLDTVRMFYDDAQKAGYRL